MPVIGHARNVSLPVSAMNLANLETRRLRELLGRAERVLGKDLVLELVAAVRRGVEGEGSLILNSPSLVEDFPLRAQLFWARVLEPLTKLSLRMSLYAAERRAEEFKEVEVEAAKEVTKALRSTARPSVEDLVYALSALIDHDFWVVDKIGKYGVNGLLERLAKRAQVEVLEASTHIAHLTFTWASASWAVLGLTSNYREDNLETLISWSREYAREVDAYIDTLDLLVDDEAYEELVKEGAIVEQRP